MVNCYKLTETYLEFVELVASKVRIQRYLGSITDHSDWSRSFSLMFLGFFLIQFYIPFKIILAHMRWANQSVGRKRENPEKNHLAHPQAELGLSHIGPERVLEPTLDTRFGSLQWLWSCRDVNAYFGGTFYQHD